MTARAGLDEALTSVPLFSIGSATPYMPCTHVHTDNLRGSLTMLTAALSGQDRPTGTRVPDEVPQTELRPPAFRGPGIRYRDAMTVLDAALPEGADIVVDAGNIGASAIHYLPVRRRRPLRRRARHGRDGIQLRGRCRHGFCRDERCSEEQTARRSRHRHCRRRLILHARHGDSHRNSVSAADYVPAVRQPCACDVRDARADLL